VALLLPAGLSGGGVGAVDWLDRVVPFVLGSPLCQSSVVCVTARRWIV
jgi:hypothetical protein